jgi:hypothetical protein
VEFHHSSCVSAKSGTLTKESNCCWFGVQIPTTMTSVSPQNELVLLLQCQIHIINGPCVFMIRGCEFAISITHKTRLGRRRIYQRIDDRIRWASVNSIYPGVACRSLPFVWDKSRVDLIDLIELEHRCVLAEYSRLWQRGRGIIRGGKSVRAKVCSLISVACYAAPYNFHYVT